MKNNKYVLINLTFQIEGLTTTVLILLVYVVLPKTKKIEQWVQNNNYNSKLDKVNKRLSINKDTVRCYHIDNKIGSKDEPTYWDWSKVDYNYNPPLLVTGKLVECGPKNLFMSNKPGAIPISDEEFLQHFCGFLDADGSFSINIQEDRIMFQVRISIHTDDKAYLLKIQQILGIGGISKSGDSLVAWDVGDLHEIANILIPLFDRYPFVSAKAFRYKYFKEACLYKLNNAHGKQVTTEERNYLYNLKIKMSNKPSSLEVEKLKEKIKLNGRLTPYQLLGFIEGDGSFSIQAHHPCISISQHSIGEGVLELIGKYFMNIPHQNMFKYNFDIPDSVRSSVHKSLSGDGTMNYSITILDAICYYLLPFFWYLDFQTRKGVDFKLWVVAVLLVKRRISKSTQGRVFLDKLQHSMNSERYSNNYKVDRSKFVSLEEVNSMLRLPSKVDLDSKFVSTEETMVEEKVGLSNAERSIKVYIYDSHDYYNPVSGSPFSSQKGAARALLEWLGSSSETGIRSALDTSRLYLGRLKITSTPWSPSSNTSTNLSQNNLGALGHISGDPVLRPRQLISNKPGNIGTMTIVGDLVKNAEVGIFPSFKSVCADMAQWERPLDISPQKLAGLTKQNMTYNGYKFYLNSHLPEAFYKGNTNWWNS